MANPLDSTKAPPQPISTSRLALKPVQSGSLFYLFFFLSIGSFAPFINVHFSNLGLTGQQIGWLSILSPLASIFLATPISALSDRKRWRIKIAQIELVGLGLSVFFLQFPTSFPWIAVVMLPFAVGLSPIMSNTDSLIARMARKYNLNYGGMRLWGSVGMATSALVFGGVWQIFGFGSMFLVGALILLPLLWITTNLEEPPRKEKQERGRISLIFNDRVLVLLLIANFLANIPMSLSLTFEGVFINSLGGGNFLIGLMMAFSAYSELPTMFFSRQIGERLRGLKSLTLAFGLMSIAYLGFVLTYNPVILPFFGIFKGLGFGLLFTTTVRIIHERAPEEWSATAQSLMTVGMFGLAPLISGPLGGLLYDAISPRSVFVVGLIALALAAVTIGLASTQMESKKGMFKTKF